MNEIIKEKKLIAVYGRVSTSAQEVQETIESQLLQVYKFAEEHDYTVVKEYLDEGWSGDILARPSLDELRLDAKKHLWEAVLIYDPDRLGRRYFYQELVMDELNQLGIETLFVTVPSVKDLNDRMMGGMRGLFAEYERAKISERFRMGKINRINNGGILASEAPYGYTYILNNGKRGSAEYKVGHFEINEKEAEIVRNIFGWVGNEGLTLRNVVRRLQSMNIPPRKSKRGVWNTSTLSTLLRNRTYLGDAHWGASYAVVPEKPLKDQKYKKIKKTSRKMNDKSKWFHIKVPRILENDDLFYRAGERLRINYEMSSRNTKNEYLLSGKIFCVCGSRRTGEGPQHGKHLYYRCSNRVNSFPLPQTCFVKGINARISDRSVWEEIIKMITTPELLATKLDSWMNKKKDKKDYPIVDIDGIEKEISKLKIQADRYNKAYSEGLFTVEKLKEYLVPIREKIAFCESQILKSRTEANSVEAKIVPNEDQLTEFIEEATRIFKDPTLNFEQKKSIIISIVEKIISSREELTIYGYIPLTLGIISNVEYFTSDRNRGPPKRRQIDAF